MDENQRRARLPAASSAKVKPLHVRKASQIHPPHGQPSSTESKINNINKPITVQPVYPPRTSSLRTHPSYCDPEASTRTKTPSPALEGEEPIIVASSKSPYPSDTSSSIMGDFVPIDSPNMAGLTPNMDPTQEDYLRSTFKPFKSAKANPYEFEPSSPYVDSTRETTFTDFINKGREVPPTLTPRAAHVKNSRSEGNAAHIQGTAHVAATPTSIKPNGHALSKCESSPNLQQLQFASRHDAPTSPDILDYYMEARETGSPAPRGRQDFQDSSQGGQNFGVKYASQSARQVRQDNAQERPLRSPTRRSPQGPSRHGYAVNRSMTRSPTKTLDDVSEKDEFDDIADIPPPCPPQKRSRSPVKKMFGDNGWLGKSPDDKPDPKPGLKNSFVTHMDFAHRPKKTGMMEKLKNKFDEIAEKADFSPMGRSRSNSDKQKQSVLTISIGPPEQARIYMEIELMLVHTANSFLMNQFSQGRMDIDSIKKIVESWKNKGRPIVIEFMYDQTTQRELVVANQHSFRFHGHNAGSDTRINSMLYNWKQVANLMLIRTFCNADTVILKLLFDIEQILELLGAVEPIMIRLRQIRATGTELMRIARLSKESAAKVSSQGSFRGKEQPRTSDTSATSTVYSTDDQYGLLNPKSDFYRN